MSPHDIILKGDNTLFKVGDTLDKKIYARILKFISQNSNYGKVSIDKKELAILDDIILKEIRDSGYNIEVNNYFKLFNELENAISKEQSEINNIKVSKIKELWNDSAQKQFIIEKTVYDLGVNGIKDVFVKAISEVVRDSTFFNLDLETAENKLRKLLVDDEYTTRYLRQTTMDTLSQYDGAINNEVRVTYDFKIMNYITNTIETSRPICVQIHDVLGGKITEQQLKDTLLRIKLHITKKKMRIMI